MLATVSNAAARSYDPLQSNDLDRCHVSSAELREIKEVMIAGIRAESSSLKEKVMAARVVLILHAIDARRERTYIAERADESKSKRTLLKAALKTNEGRAALLALSSAVATKLEGVPTGDLAEGSPQGQAADSPPS
jgi:hypothetical protein